MDMSVVQAGSRPLRVREPIFRNQGGTAEDNSSLAANAAGDFLFAAERKRKGELYESKIRPNQGAGPGTD